MRVVNAVVAVACIAMLAWTLFVVLETHAAVRDLYGAAREAATPVPAHVDPVP